MPQITRRRMRRYALPVVALCMATMSMAFVSTTPAHASADDCSATVPPGSFTTFKATFSNGTMKLGSATGSGLAAKACGGVFVENGGLVMTVQPGDIAFAPVSVKVLFLSLPATVTVNSPISGPIFPSPDFTSADAALKANISASASLLGFKCVIGPLTPTLTTGKSGSLTGKSFTGSFTEGMTGTVVANDFAVPGIKSSRSCPWLVATLANTLVGLPAAPGKASMQMDGAVGGTV